MATYKPSKAKTTTIYLKNKDFLLEIIESKKQDKLTYKAEQMMILLANKSIMKMYYSNSDDKLDCLQTGIMDMLMNWRNFDPTKSENAFAYFTEIAKRGFARQWNIQYVKKGDPEKKTKTYSYNRTLGDGENDSIGWII